MMLTPKLGCGYSCPDVQFSSQSEVVRACGNSLVLLDIYSQQQRLLVGSGHGIKCFTCNSKAGLIAVAEQGYKPRVSIYKQADLRLLQTVPAGAEFGYTGVALSGDGELLAVCSDSPDQQLSVWQWRKATSSASQIRRSTDSSTKSSSNNAVQSQVQLWRLDKLWSKHELQSKPIQLPASCTAVCCAWAPEGLYIGCSNGSICCIALETASVLGTMLAHPASQPGEAAAISSISVNRDAVAAASSTSPEVMFYSRVPGPQQDKQQQLGKGGLQLLGSVQVSTKGCDRLCYGGLLNKDLVVSTTDGSLLLLTRSSISGTATNNSSSGPADVQVEPLADCHISSITGLAPSPDGAHLLSCGLDGSVRAWDAATGQLMGKRDLGGRLTCCAAAIGAATAGATSKPILAVGSEAGVLRLLAVSDIQQLPVMYRARLTRMALTHVAFSPGGSCLAAAAAAEKRVALLGIRGCQHIDILGYYTATEPILSMSWFQSNLNSQAQLLISLKDSGLAVLTPPMQPHNHSTSSISTPPACDNGCQALELTAEQLQMCTTATEAPLLHVAAVPLGSVHNNSNGNRPAVSSNGGSATGQTEAQQQQPAAAGPQMLAIGTDGMLHRLGLPADAAGWHALKGKQLRSTMKLQLPSSGAAVAVSPNGAAMLIAGKDGSVTVLPAGSNAAAAAAVAAASSLCGSGSSNGILLAHGYGDRHYADVLTWSPAGQWAATAAKDGSLMLHTAAVAELVCEPPRVLSIASEAIEDQESPDDTSAATLPEAAAAAAQTEAFNAGAAVRQATLQRLQALQVRLAQVLEANAAAPADQRLSEADLIVNLGRLSELRAAVDAEVTNVMASTVAETQVQEIRAKRLKTLCWDSMQTKPAICTGLKSGVVEVSNFPLPSQDDTQWTKVANLRRIEMIEAAAQCLPTGDQLYRSNTDEDIATAAKAQTAVTPTAPVATSSCVNVGAGAAPASDDADVSMSMSGGTSDGSTAAAAAAAAAAEAAAASMIVVADTPAQKLLASIGSCAATACKAKDLLYSELDVTHPIRKLTQAELYKRMVWELKSQFNEEFNQLVKQKHKDADRLADLSSRMDELIKELVKVSLILAPEQPAAAAPTGAITAVAAQSSAVAAQPSAATVASAVGQQLSVVLSAGPSTADGTNAGAVNASSSNGLADAEAAAADLMAELNAGRLVPHWSPLEELEDMLFSVNPGEIKAQRYLSAAERAKLAAEEAAAEEARRKAEADDSADRALKQMMGGRLERAVDEVADLVASRPAWMAGDPANFSEEQLRLYKEYCAKEQAVIEERLKRKAVMETELRTLKASAVEIAAKFDEAVAALANKRLDVLMEITALESRILRLLADYEMAAVTAGRAAEQAAEAELHKVQEQLSTVNKELSETQQLHDQQQESLAALHGEERQLDRGMKREFAEADSTIMPKLIAMYKSPLVAAVTAATQASSTTSATHGVNGFFAASNSGTTPRAAAGAATAANATDSAELEFVPMGYSVAHGAAVFANAAGGGAAAAAAAAASGNGENSAAVDLRGPLGPVAMEVSALSDAQRPEGLDIGLWERFVEYRATRGRLDIAVREQTAKLLSLQRQAELLLQRQTSLTAAAAAAAQKLDGLTTQRAAAQYDVELQLRLKQGQVEVPFAGVSGTTPDAVLVGISQVQGLNAVIQSKGAAKMELLQQMKEFKRGIYMLQWENKKCDMEAEDVTHLTQQLQLLHVTKDFQQLVKASSTSSTAAAATGSSAAAGGGSSSVANAASKEIQSLENLLKVRDQLQAKAVEEKQRQLRCIEGQIAAKVRENASVALHLTGLEKLLDDRSRLEGAAAAGNPDSDRVARSLMMQRQLRDIAAAQAAEIAAARAELNRLQQRCFPSFPTGSDSSSMLCAPAAGPGAAGGITTAAPLTPRTAPLTNMAAAATTAAAAAAYGGGVVASGGGVFAPTGSRNKQRGPLKAPYVGPDAKVSQQPQAQAGRTAGAAKLVTAGKPL